MSGIFVADAALDNHTVALAEAIVSTIEVYAAKNSLGGFSKTSLIESDIDVVSIARTAIICGMDVKPESWREDYELDGEVEDSVIHAESAFAPKTLSPGSAFSAFAKKAGVVAVAVLAVTAGSMAPSVATRWQSTAIDGLSDAVHEQTGQPAKMIFDLLPGKLG